MGIEWNSDGAGDRVRRTAKRALFHVAQTVGLFRLARRVTGRSLRILCYHGVAMDDEARFSPTTFITESTLRGRLEMLARGKYPVLDLDAAVERLRKGDLPPAAVVITFDDGFYSTATMAVPMLREMGLPATIYVTTYQCVKETPAFTLLVRYLFWKSPRTEVDLSGLVPGGPERVVLTDGAAARRAVYAIIKDAQARLTEPERVDLCRRLGERLGVDYDEIARSRRINVMTTEEVRRAAAEGVDIQLHTHRHRMPEDEAGVLREIADNRGVLEPLVGRQLRHFCYPSGVWSEERFPWLVAAGVQTATTCDAGLNDADTPPLALGRFLDGEHIAPIEFEAELCGFSELDAPRAQRSEEAAPAMKRGVYITIDVECSMGGAYGDPARRPVHPDRAMMGDYGGRPMGLPLIVDLLTRAGLAGTFFLEPFTEEQGFPGEGERVARYLIARGQDVQLHVHPAYCYYARHRAGLPYPKTDEFFDLTPDEARELVVEGARRILAWTGRAPVAFRAGNMGASEATLPVLAAAGIRIDSSYTWPYAGGQCRFSVAGSYNGSKWYGDVLEVALSGVRRPRVPGLRRGKPLDLVGISFEECRDGIRRIVDAGADAVVIFHSFSLFKVRNLAYDDGRPDRIVTRRLRRLCDWLGENADRYPVHTFARLAEAVAAGEYEAAAVAPPTVFGPRAIVRKAVQVVNRLYWT